MGRLPFLFVGPLGFTSLPHRKREIPMSAGRMHVDEIETSVSLVQRLLAVQFPEWAHLPVRPVPSSGTDHALYRLGGDMVVRLPRIARAGAQVDKEQRWLPHLAPSLPLSLPRPLARGSPAAGYPCSWSICQWLDGEDAIRARLADHRQTALDLARFIAALQRVDPTGGPPPGEHNSFRGEALARRDGRTREAIATVRTSIERNVGPRPRLGAVGRVDRAPLLPRYQSVDGRNRPPRDRRSRRRRAASGLISRPRRRSSGTSAFKI